MKKTFSFFILVLFSVSVGYAQQQALSLTPAAGAVLSLKESQYDFGTIPQGRPVTHDFEIVNTGSRPLLIEDVQASCGCTSPQWDPAPIPAGKSGQVKVGFNAAAEGPFSKTITIHYNEGQVKTLMIAGEVYPSPPTSAPLNRSLSLIKQIN